MSEARLLQPRAEKLSHREYREAQSRKPYLCDLCGSIEMHAALEYVGASVDLSSLGMPLQSLMRLPTS
jgi:hypothetical protein